MGLILKAAGIAAAFAAGAAFATGTLPFSDGDSHLPDNAQAQIERAVTKAAGNAGYSREKFMPGGKWSDLDHDGCDTRQEILRRDMRDEGVKGCKVLSGILIDRYSGKEYPITNPGDQVDADHIAALEWVWSHGASGWTAARREQYANDPLVVVATTAHINRSKGADGPAGFRPTSKTGRCWYAIQFARIVAKYDLTIGPRDVAALKKDRASCG